MNKNHIDCSSQDLHLTITYEVGLVAFAIAKDTTGEIIFHMRDGKEMCLDITDIIFPDISYLKQFGISVTNDGKYFFIQDWKTGLYCFKLQSGTLVWHCKQKKAYDLVVRENSVICHFFEKSIVAFDIESGNELSCYPLGINKIFLPITDDYYLIGPKNGKYLVIDGELKIVYRIPYQHMNPHLLDTFIINKACMADGGIQISGFEYILEEFMDAIRNKTCDNNDDTFRFSRFVAVDLFRDNKAGDGPVI